MLQHAGWVAVTFLEQVPDNAGFLQTLIKQTGADDFMGYSIALFAIACAAVVFLSWTAAVQCRKYRQSVIDAELKRDMLDRGMSAEDIVRVLTVRPSTEPSRTPDASEVVVEQDGEWYAAIVLKHAGPDYLVHYKGYDEEEWVIVDRVRFPASAVAEPVSQGFGQE